jgi:hypothetical protein
MCLPIISHMIQLIRVLLMKILPIFLPMFEEADFSTVSQGFW